MPSYLITFIDIVVYWKAAGENAIAMMFSLWDATTGILGCTVATFTRVDEK